MNSIKPKYRRPLNDKQLYLLKLIYKFRFVTIPLISASQGKPETSVIHDRLERLRQLRYIGRNYDGTYRLQNKPANYFLLGAGIRVLSEHTSLSPKVLHSTYGDKAASEQFTMRNLALFAVYNHLRSNYGTNLQYFAKSELVSPDYDYFPQPLPDAYIRLKNQAGAKEFFLNYVETTRPFFATTSKLKKYIEYAENATWSENSELPTILIVCEVLALERRLHKQLPRLPGVGELEILTTTKDRLKSSSKGDEIWYMASEPDVLLSLGSL